MTIFSSCSRILWKCDSVSRRTSFCADIGASRSPVEIVARPANLADLLDQQIEIARPVDEVQILAVDDQQRRAFVLIEELGVALVEPAQVFLGDAAFDFPAAPLLPFHQR